VFDDRDAMTAANTAALDWAASSLADLLVGTPGNCSTWGEDGLAL
jgi:hypothetical protein